VTPKGGDAVAVVTRSVEAPDEVLEEASNALTPEGGPDGSDSETTSAPENGESPDVGADATIEDETTSSPVSSESGDGPEVDPGE
jgi:hypothetical protein